MSMIIELMFDIFAATLKSSFQNLLTNLMIKCYGSLQEIPKTEESLPLVLKMEKSLCSSLI